MISKVRQRIANCKKGKGATIKRYCIDQFKDPETVDLYKETIVEKINSFVTQNIDELQICEQWNLVKNVIIGTAEIVLGLTNGPTPINWFDQECEEKNKAYVHMLQEGNTQKAMEEYKNKRREEKRREKVA